MTDFIALFNPDGLTIFTPDIILRCFGFVLAVDLIGAIIETLIKGVRDK